MVLYIDTTNRRKVGKIHEKIREKEDKYLTAGYSFYQPRALETEMDFERLSSRSSVCDVNDTTYVAEALVRRRWQQRQERFFACILCQNVALWMS